MKASLLLLNAVILALAFSTIQGAPASPYAACKDGSSLCLGLGTVSEIKADSPSCVTSEHCAFFFKSTFSASSGFHFSLTAPTLPADRFIAVAMSNETGMAGLVVQCFHNSATGKNTIEYSFNEGYHNKAIPDQRSVIGLASPTATYANGGLSCSWTAPANGHVSYKGHEDFNLLTTAYYLKMATGAVNSSTGAISRHATHDATGRVAASAAVNLSKAKGIILAKEVHHKAPPSSVFASPELPQDGQSGLYDQCKANTALCFGLPEGCTTTGNCKFFFKSVYASGSGFTFSLIAPSIAADQYVAVAFSPLSGMSGLVVQCFHAPSGANTIQYSFNKEYDNELITDPGKDLKGFTHPVTTYSSGQLNCQWTVPAGGKVVYKDNSFDFEHVQYFLKVATGAVKGGAISKHAHDGRLASKTAVSLKAKGTIHGGGGGGAATAIKWHASLMIFGWIGCVTVAIIMARFTRDLWPEKKFFGTKYWFVVHRYLMIIGWLAIVASYVVIFVQFGGWTHTSSHSVMGIVAGILATLQIGNSFLRPGPDSPHRWIFDYGHWFIGNTAHILALANIINSGLKRSKAFLWLLLAYLFVYLLFSDLLKKLENRIRGSSFSKRTPVVLQAAVAGAVLTVASITTALIAIMFTS